MMQGGGMHQDWRITADDRAKHDAQFAQLKPINGYITGDAARGFFMQSGLPQQLLGHIWMLSDMNADGKLDKLEFSIAMYLIKKKLSGVELPRTLPPSLKQAPAPAMGGFGMQPMGMVRPMGGFGAMPGMPAAPMQPGGFNTMPARTPGNMGGFGGVPAQPATMARGNTLQSSPERGRASSIGAEWGVPHNAKLKYTQMFNTQDRTRSGFLTGAQARNVLVQSGLGQAHLAQIWGLSDVDNDGRLTTEEFCLAMHLVDMVKAGKALPQKLPPDMVPPSYRRGRSSSLTSASGVAPGGMPPPPVSAAPLTATNMMGGLGAAPLGGLGGLGGGPPPLGGGLMAGGGLMGSMPLQGGMGPGGPQGGIAAPLSPASLVKQPSMDEPAVEEEKFFSPVSFEDRKRQNFEKGQQELERRRAALREVQEREKARQREIEQQEQERKEKIRMEQERRRQLELERQMQKQREIEAEREAQRRKMEEQREAARRELERQRQMEIDRQKRQELEAKRIKSQEEVCHLKATSKTLACEIETLEDKKNELNKKINETYVYVKEHQTKIILMSQNRDTKVAEIDHLQQKIQELRQVKHQRAQQKDELQEQAKKLNINVQVSDTYAAVMTSYTNKQKVLEKLRAACEEVERNMASRLQDTDNSHAKLSEMKASLAREQNEVDQLQKQFQAKTAEFTKTKKNLEDQKKYALLRQNQQNEKIRQDALQKRKEEETAKAEAERRRKEEEEKKRKEEEQKPKKADPFAAFAGVSMQSTKSEPEKKDAFAAFGGSKDNDPFASAFDSNATATTNSDPSDPFAAFSGGGSVQSTKSDSEKKDPFSSFADFSNSTFDFDKGFQSQTSKTSSSAAVSSTTTTTATGSAAATLATSFTPTPQPRTVNAPSTTTTKPDLIQPVAQPVAASRPNAAKDATPAPQEATTNHVPAPLPKDLKSVLSQYRALYQFDAEGPDELSIKPGDIILVGKEQGGEPGWLGGELNGRTGWFPENYAEKLPSPPTTPMKPHAENGVVIATSDMPSWSSIGGSKITTEPKQQSSPPVAPTSAITASSASSTLASSPAPVVASSPAPSPAPTPQTSQEPPSRSTPPVSQSTPTPTPPPTASSSSSSSSVSALAARFTAAAEASTVPQVSKPKVIESEPMPIATPPTEAAVDEPVYDVLGGGSGAPKEAEDKPGASSFTKVLPQTSATPSPIPNQGTITPEGTRAKTLYDWDAKKDNHLSFKAGQVITVREKQDHWWLGELDGRQGWFPKTHVQSMESAPQTTTHNFQNVQESEAIYANTPKPQPDNSAFAIYANTPKVAKQPSPASIPSLQQPAKQLSVSPSVTAQPDNSVTQQQPNASPQPGEACTALYTYSSEEPGDLAFEAGERIMVVKKDGEWWTGKIGEREGIFPSNYVQLNQQEEGSVGGQATSSGGGAGGQLAPQAVPADVAAKSGSLSRKPDLARVIASYEATGEEQLSLTVGQLIMVRKKNPSGWWEGELQARGKKRQIGWFPANYVKSMESGGGGGGGAKTPLEPPKSPNVLAAPSQANQRLTPGIELVCQVITIYAYAKQNEDELSFQKGMVINVLNKDDPDWWRGELNGAEGVFPSNYVQELGESKSAPNTEWTHDVSLLQSMSEVEQHRQSRIHELIQTEQAYVDDMQLAVEVFQVPMLESQMMTPQEMASVFVNWKELIQCNTKLLKALRVRKKMSGENRPVNMIGDILCEQLPRMTPYIRFCSCQLSASNILSKKIEGDPDFKDYVKRLATDTRTKGMPVSSYLIKPMQRITRYPLLVQKILKYTPESHADFANIKSAKEKAEELCQQVNEGVREKENSDRLEWLQNHVDCTGLAEELIFNSLTNCLGPRKYLHAGKLNKAKSNKELYVFLFNDFLLFTQAVKSGLPAPFTTADNKNIVEYKMYKHPLFLNEVELKVPSDVAPDDFVFHINHIDKVYALRAESNNDRNRWKEKIEKASKHYVETEKKKREKLQRVRSQRSKGVGRLMVVIIEGFDLKPSNSVTGRADPYCEVSMGSQEHKTKVVPDNLNPIWDSSMQFIVRDLQEDVLCITVYDRDFFSPNDFLGRTEVRVASILKETQGRGPVTKRLLLHEVSTGEVKVKLTLHLFDQS